ncbi:Pro neuregulin 2 membrane bound [Fasciolopsis buskii]|uniref:Pro neuregulin 2 membrane bound n=1 Tax=Fasciolopsis buskii TaxID=27845 RepID=A0A8E0RTZ1_9TREM|nr:Pro neuregulin 2 membrane bound [Fasciolopsis buski]
MCYRDRTILISSLIYDIHSYAYLFSQPTESIYNNLTCIFPLKFVDQTAPHKSLRDVQWSRSSSIDPSPMTKLNERNMQSNDIWTNLLMMCVVQKLFSITQQRNDLTVFRMYHQSLGALSPLSCLRTVPTDQTKARCLIWPSIWDKLLQRHSHSAHILDRWTSAQADHSRADSCFLSVSKPPRLRSNFCSLVNSDWWKIFLCIFLLFSHMPSVCLSSIQQPAVNSTTSVNATNSSHEASYVSPYSSDDMIVIDITQYEYHNAAQYLIDVRQFKPPSPELPCRYRFREDVETSALLADYVIVGWPRQAFRRRYGPLYNISLLVTNVLKQSRRPTRAIFPIRVGHLLRVGQFSVLPDPGRCWLNVQPGRAYMFFIRQPDWSGFCQISQLPVEYSEVAYERVINVLTHGSK